MQAYYSNLSNEEKLIVSFISQACFGMQIIENWTNSDEKKFFFFHINRSFYVNSGWSWLYLWSFGGMFLMVAVQLLKLQESYLSG